MICQLSFLAPYVYLHFVDPMPGLFSVFINAALVLNVFYLFYLFLYKKSKDGRFFSLMASFPLIASIIVLLPIMSLTSLFYLPDWRSLLAVLLIVNFSMDTGAWFFGKKFGKHKLWEAVSPKKTIEGLVGGALTAAIVASFSWFLLFETFNWQLILFFGFLGVMSQIGDLIQSKIKRQFAIKDSSSLIPGHGGVYDRLDGLLFVTPFFATLINAFYFFKA
jgi:phosphatidate cytidylyltransferase